jgi:hypothetical protein
MSEGNANVEIAHHAEEVHERARSREEKKVTRRERVFEVAEAVLLAVVAIATAWSGYQAARWDGRSAEFYGQSSRLRVTAEGFQTTAGQQLLYDTTTFNAWLAATLSGDEKQADFLERRFRPEYTVAFDAWLATDPFNNPSSPPGPIFVSQYHNSLLDRAASASQAASDLFDAGTTARDTGDEYVRITVLLAAVLFVIAISQRFDMLFVRLGMLGVGGVLLVYSLYSLATFPHIV